MARKTKTEAEATREAVLDAAEAVFMGRGVDKASLEQIVRGAGATRGAVYWHFRNKDDVFDAMLDRVRLPLTEMIERVTLDGATERQKAPVGWQQIAASTECG